MLTIMWLSFPFYPFFPLSLTNVRSQPDSVLQSSMIGSFCCCCCVAVTQDLLFQVSSVGTLFPLLCLSNRLDNLPSFCGFNCFCCCCCYCCAYLEGTRRGNGEKEGRDEGYGVPEGYGDGGWMLKSFSVSDPCWMCRLTLQGRTDTCFIMS